MLPKTVYRVITEVIIPQVKDGPSSVKGKTKTKKTFRSGIKTNKHMCNTCASCKNRYVCWVKDYGYTIGVFEDIKRALRGGKAVLPEHFRTKCAFPDGVISELTAASAKNFGYKIEYAKCSEPKAGQTVCGDTCCVFSSSEKRKVVCLADGMGSGPAAAKDSVKFSRLMENLMTKGISKEDAIRVINETIINSGYETVLALDIAVIDLNTGVCEFVKAGAAPTYVIRNGSLYELGSGSVPIGILDEPELEYERSMLIENDVVVMVSDGLISDGAQWLAALVKKMSELETQSPLLLSSNIISKAKELKKHILDDITVVAVKIVSE